MITTLVIQAYQNFNQIQVKMNSINCMMRHLPLIFFINFIDVHPHGAEGILSSNDITKSGSDSNSSDVLTVPVNATQDEFLEIFSRIRFVNIIQIYLSKDNKIKILWSRSFFLISIFSISIS